MLNNSDSRPIGVFDSGLGGISVVREIGRLLPNENIIYIGDNLNNPYGTKSKDEILRITLDVVDRLIKMNVKAVVIACNTATSAAVRILREKYNIPIVGMEPAIKPAVMENKGGTIGVMATISTLKEKKFQNNMDKFKDISNIYKIPTQELVELVENDIFSGDEINRVLDKHFYEYRDIKFDAIVLGCTHFIFLKDSISDYFKGIKIYDGNEGTVNRLKNLLMRDDILNYSNQMGKLEIIFTRENDKFKRRAIDLMK
jgi:glutamate racemase